MSTNFEQDIQSTRNAFIAGSLPPDLASSADWQIVKNCHVALPSLDLLPLQANQVLTKLQETFKDLSSSQQSQLAEIEELAAKDGDAFKARMAALRQTTIASVNAAIDKAYEDLKNAGLQAPASQPLILEAVQRVAQLAQGFVNTVGSSLDAVDHAGSLVIGGLSEGASEVGKVFSTAGDTIKKGAETVLDGLESVFSGW
jgi:hypothetical protein